MLGSGRLQPYMARMAAQWGGEVSERKIQRHYGFWIIHMDRTKSYNLCLHYYRVVSKWTIFLVNIDDRDLRLSNVEI